MSGLRCVARKSPAQALRHDTCGARVFAVLGLLRQGLGREGTGDQRVKEPPPVTRRSQPADRNPQHSVSVVREGRGWRGQVRSALPWAVRTLTSEELQPVTGSRPELRGFGSLPFDEPLVESSDGHNDGSLSLRLRLSLNLRP